MVVGHFKNLVFLSTLVLFIFSCQRSGQESDQLKIRSSELVDPIDFDLDKIKERGVLIAIVDNSSTGHFLYKGQPMGYEYELLSMLAEELGVQLETTITTSISDAFEMLNRGEGDIIAYSLTVTKGRKEKVAFTENHFTTRQVLVQKKPSNWRKMSLDNIDKSLIRNQVDLIGKEIYVRKGSSHIDRLQNLSQEVGGDIIILEAADTVETEGLIKNVAAGKIKYAIADEMLAHVNASYYPQIDVNTPISFPQQIAWAVRKNSNQLVEYTNKWIHRLKKEPTFNIIYNRYYLSPRTSSIRAKSEFSSFGGGKISPYDDLVKEASKELGWDWELVVAQMFQESRFDPNAKSWANAYGLMQLIPETGKRFGAQNLYDPKQNISAATKFLIYLDSLWAKTIDDENERIKFVLASYNVGIGHVQDARDLAKKYDHDPLIWDDNVEKYLRLKSRREYFTDPVVSSGYCRGEEPVQYVKEILNYYNSYKQLIDS